MKKIISLLLTVSMLFSCISIIPVSADDTFNYTHETIPEDITWEALGGSHYTMSAGTYYLYLNSDTGSSNSTLIISSGVTVYLCLNDHTYTQTGNNKTAIRVNSGGTLNIYDIDNGTVREYDNPATLTDISDKFTVTGGAITGGKGDIENDGGGIYIDGGTVNMYGGNIVGNSTNTEDTTGLGGGVYLDSGSVFNMYGGSISGNTSYGHAGGVYVQSGASFTMDGGTISNNYTNTSTYQSYAGGVYVAGTFTMNGGEICYNNPYCGGGAVSVIGTFNLNGGSLHHNTNQAGSGGAVFLGSGAKFYMTGGDITHNTSPASAGGVNINNATAMMNMSGGTISYNKANGYGGGVVTMNTSTSLILSGDAEITNNTAGYSGGGIYMNNGDIYASGAVKVTDNVSGGTIVCNEDGTHSLTGGSISNAYLQTDKNITISGELTGEIGVTYAGVTGTVGTSSSTYTATVDDKNKFTADNDSLYVIKNGGNVELAAASDTLGNDKEVEYSHTDIDVTTLSMFNNANSDTTYTITPVTGSGTVSEDGTELSEYSVGTYTVTADTPYSDTSAPVVETATLTVTQVDVTITGLEAVNRGVSASDRTVELTGGALNGVLTGDEVEIDLSIAYGYIKTSTYAFTAGTYDIDIYGVAISGDDAHNYNLVSAEGDTQVEILADVPYISWPDALDIVYGDTRDSDDLHGGKVVVYDASDDVYITITGSFQWVGDDLTAEDSIGEYSYSVKFVPNSGFEDYEAELEKTTHTINQIVRAAEVEFDITNYVYSVDEQETPIYSTIVEGVKEDLDKGTSDVSNSFALSANADYAIVYSTTSGWTNDVPTTAGIYPIATVLNPDKYVVIGSLDAIKQIGMLYIYNGDTVLEPTKYEVKYDGELVEDIEAYPGEILVLPTVENYSGWSYEYGGTTTYYDFSSRFTMPSNNVEFTLVATPTADKTISGTVSGTDLDGKVTNLEGIGVTLVQGGEVIATATTDENGDYSFNVAADRYNIVFTRDQGIKNEETVFVDVTEGNATVDVNLPDTMQNTVLYIASGMTAITVSGLKDYDGEIDGVDENVSVRLSITTSTDTTDILTEAAKSGLTTDNIKLFYDIKLEKLTTSGYETVDTIGEDTLTIYIPISGMYQGKTDYVVYTEIGDEISSYAANIDENGTLLELTISDTGIYALSFREVAATEITGTNTSTTYSSDSYDLSGLFTFKDADDADIDYTDAVYTITSADTGVATVDGSELDVSKIGTFTVTVNIPATADTPAYTGTATLTVDPATLTISQLTAQDKPLDSTNSTSVSLNEQGDLSGRISGDDVSIDFTNVVANITDEDYYNDSSLTTNGYRTFEVEVTGLTITGDDAGNYVLSTEDVTTSVYVYKDIPYFSWPSATSVIVGATPSNNDLYGGKVMVRDPEGGYTLLEGSFEWVETPEATTQIGTLSKEVKFVETAADTNSSYYADLVATTQEVSQIVMASSVKFNVSNNVVEKGSSDYPVIEPELVTGTIPVQADDYTIQYFYTQADGTYSTATTELPTDVGTYFITATFNDMNYIHAGTLVSDGKQIGALYIYEDTAPTSYSITFEDENGDSINGVDTITPAYPQEIYILPSISGDDYIGWYYDVTGASYAFGERFPMQSANVTLTAIEAPDTYTISGTITGTDLDNTPNTVLYKVGVAIMQGDEVVEYHETDENGEYSFDVSAGLYHVVVTRDIVGLSNIETVYVDARYEDQVVDLTLPDIRQNAIIEVAAGVTDLAVEGLTALVQSEANVENTITLTVGQYVYDEENDTEDEQVAIQNVAYDNGLSNDNLKYFLDINLTEEKVEGRVTELTETSQLLTFYIPLTGTLQGFENYAVYRYHDGSVDILTTEANEDGEYIAVDGTTLVMKANHFSTMGIAAYNDADLIEYGLTPVFEKEAYNLGDTVTVNVTATVPESEYGELTIAHYQFSLDYDTSKLELVEVVEKYSGNDNVITAGSNGIYLYVTNGESFNDVGEDGLILATATFNVIDGEYGDGEETTMAFNEEDVVIENNNSGGDSTINLLTDSTTLYALTVAFQYIDNFASGTDSTAIARYNETGLYTSTDYDQTYNVVTPVLTSPVTLTDGEEWITTDGTIIFDHDLLGVAETEETEDKYKFTKSLTLVPNVDDIVFITFDCTVGGAISQSSMAVIEGSVINTITLPTTTALENYTFDGWYYANGDKFDPTSTDALDESITLTAKFVADEYEIDGITSNGATVTGVAEGDSVTYGEDIEFTVEMPTGDDAIDGVIGSVTYTVSDGSTSVTIYDQGNGKYIIPGEQLTGDVSITVNVVSYVKVSFANAVVSENDNTATTTGAEGTAYAIVGVNGLYTDVDKISTGTPDFTIPTPTAVSGYRLADVLWVDGDGVTTNSENIQYTMSFSKETTFTAQTVKTYDVSFASGSNGSLSDTDTITVDENTAVSDVKMPTPTAETGYEFTGWTSDPAISTGTITANTKFTANFDVASYTLTYDSTYINVTAGETSGEATYNTDLIFEKQTSNTFVIEEVWYRIGTGEAVDITNQFTETNTSYTIEGEYITAPISIWVVIDNVYAVELDYSAEGATTQSTTTVNIQNGYDISADDIPENAAAKAGYVLDCWMVDGVRVTTPVGYTVTSNMTFTAVYVKGTYDVTASTGTTGEVVNGIPGNATYGTDLVFTPTVDDKVVTSVTATVDGKAVDVTEKDGVYTIDGEDITGKVVITVTVVNGNFIFIYDSQYKALKDDTKIAVLYVDDDDVLKTGNYQIGGVDMFYSKEYKAYLLIVSDTETVSSVSAKLAINDAEGATTATVLDYSGNVNGDSEINVIDAGRINAFLHNLVDADAMQERLQADINITKSVSVLDIEEIVKIIFSEELES